MDTELHSIFNLQRIISLGHVHFATFIYLYCLYGVEKTRLARYLYLEFFLYTYIHLFTYSLYYLNEILGHKETNL